LSVIPEGNLLLPSSTPEANLLLLQKKQPIEGKRQLSLMDEVIHIFLLRFFLCFVVPETLPQNGGQRNCTNRVRNPETLRLLFFANWPDTKN
jgi:hypothetical protein